MKRFPSQRTAFTLVELLVVIVIIAILAAILLPVIGKVTQNADSTKCNSNLRQIGTAILAYCSDHDDTLPGPLKAEQFSTFDQSSQGSLAMLLDPYLNRLQDPANKDKIAQGDKRANPFICPSHAKLHSKETNMAVYLMNMVEMTAFNQSPWGDANGSKTPLKKNVLSGWTDETEDGSDRPVNIARVWAMIDADTGVATMATPLRRSAAGANAKLASEPVHTDHRNALFFDFHVAKLPLDGDVKR